MVRVYAHLQRSYDEAAEPLPASLLKASLFYGYCRVLVRTPFVEGAITATDDEITGCVANSPLALAIADALAWLLMHDIVYTDLRGPNVLKPVHAGAAGAASAASSVANFRQPTG